MITRLPIEICIRRLVVALQHWCVLTDLQTCKNNDGQVIPARRCSAKFDMRYGDHDRYGRSALCLRYVQQPSPDDCRIGAVYNPQNQMLAFL